MGIFKEGQQENRGQQPKRVYIDLGNFDAPFIEKGLIELQPDEMYVGVDRNQMFSNYNKPENVQFIEAEGGALPFRDSSIHEIYIANLFGAPAGYNTKKDGFLNPSAKEIAMDPIKKEAIFPELHRILANDGTAIILESYTPGSAPFTKEQLPQILDNFGFEIVEFITPESRDQWKKEVQKYSTQISRSFWGLSDSDIDQPYFVRFKKKVENK